MYGDDQKESFIKEYLSSKVVSQTSLYAIFKKTKPFEVKWQKDVSEFTKEEILMMLKSFHSKSVNSLLNYVVVLKHYSRWVTGIVGKNEFESIGKKDIVDLVDKHAGALLTREDIDDIIADLLNWSDKAIIELLWEGVSGPSMKDLFFFSTQNVDFAKNTIITRTTTFDLTHNLKLLLPKAFAETELVTYGATLKNINVNGVGRIYKERANTRGAVSDDACFRYIYRKIQIFRNYLDMPSLTMKNLQASGLFYYLNIGMDKTGLGLREFLKTSEGEQLARKFGFGDYWVDNISSKYSAYF